MQRVIGLENKNNYSIKHYCSIKNKYPFFHVTYAVPKNYLQIVADHPYIDSVIDCDKFDKNQYNIVFNITHNCLRYEISKGKECDKNRSDIWAESFGLKLDNHNMHLPNLDQNKENVLSKLKKYGYQCGQKIILFTPYSAVPTRHLIKEHREIIENILSKTNAFCFYLNNACVLDTLKLPFVIGKNLIEAMSYVYFADLVISTDTGHLHCAGGYNKNILGFFNYANGKIVGKHYKNLTIVQKTKENDIKWECGPCNDLGKCPYGVVNNALKCYRDLSNDIIESKTLEFINKLNI